MKPNIPQRIILILAAYGFLRAASFIAAHAITIHNGTLRIGGHNSSYILLSVLFSALIGTLCLLAALNNLPAAKRTRTKQE